MKGLLIFIIILIYAALSKFIQPYKKNMINSLDTKSTIVCSISILLACFMYKNPFNYLVIISMIVILVINFVFILEMIKLITI